MEEEEAAAVTSWTMSCVPRELGAIIKSFVKVSAIQPVAFHGRDEKLAWWSWTGLQGNRVDWEFTHDAPADRRWFRHVVYEVSMRRGMIK